MQVYAAVSGSEEHSSDWKVPAASRRTRSGKEFSQYTFDQAIICDFDLDDLVANANAGDMSGYESPSSILGDDDDSDDDLEHDPESDLTEPSDNQSPTQLYTSSQPPKKPSPRPLSTTNTSSQPPKQPSPQPLPTTSPYASSSTKRKRKEKKTLDPAIAEAKKIKKRRYNHDLHNRKRDELADGPYSKSIGDRRCAESAIVALEDVELESLPVAKTGWQGIRDGVKRGVISCEEEREMSNMRYLNWVGDRNLVICDRKRRGVVQCIGKPRDPTWGAVVDDAGRVIEQGRRDAKFKPKQQSHRRGNFPVEAIGFSHGGGQVEPANTKHSKRNLKVLKRILRSPSIQRLSGVANSSFKRFCPGIYEEYKNNMESLREWNPNLRRNFDKTVFAATTINFGPQAVTYRHKDYQNYAPGSCAVSSMGSYDDSRGGELILWTLGIIIRFPPGCTILLPSALIEHSNGPIREGETRYSITQYSAAALFRFVANGYRNDRERLANASLRERTEWQEEQEQRWRNSVAKFKQWPSGSD